MFLVANKNSNSTLQKIQQGLILGGTLFVYGAVSAAGMYLLVPSLPLAWAAFVLGGFIEHDVFKSYVVIGSKRLKNNQAKMIRRTQLKSYLDKLILSVDELNQEIKKLSDLGVRYASDEERHRKIIARKRELENQRDTQQNFLKKLNTEKKFFARYFYLRQLQECQKAGYSQHDSAAIINELATLLDALWPRLATKQNAAESKDEIEQDIDDLMAELNKTQPDRTKKWFKSINRCTQLQYLNLAISSIAIINFYLTSTYLSTQFLVLFPLLGPLTVSIFPAIICAFAAIGYGYLVYKCMSDIISDDRFSRFIENRLKQYQRQPHDSLKSYVWRVSCTTAENLLFATVVLSATLVTFGTWYYAAEQGMALFRIAGRIAVPVFAATTTFITCIAESSFSIDAGIQAIAMIPKFKVWRNIEVAFKSSSSWENPLKTWWHNHEDETVLQRLNPFRPIAYLVSELGKAVLFIGHLVSIGAGIDRIKGVSPVPLTIVETANEAMTDIPTLFEVAEENNALPPLLAVGQKINPLQGLDQSQAKTHHHGHHCQGHGGDDDDGHSHGFMDKLVFCIAAPFNGLALIWDFIAGKNCSKKGWQESVNRFFPKDHHHHSHDEHCHGHHEDDHKHHDHEQPHKHHEHHNHQHAEKTPETTAGKQPYDAGTWAKHTLTTQLKTKAARLRGTEKATAIEKTVKLINTELTFTENASKRQLHEKGHKFLNRNKLNIYLSSEEPDLAKQRHRFFARCRNKKITATQKMISEFDKNHCNVKISRPASAA